jgi:hypothetical protein
MWTLIGKMVVGIFLGEKALVDAIHFYKTKKAETLAIIKKHCTELLRMQNDEERDCFYNTQAASLEAKPYPTLDAIQNVFALALKRDPEIKSFNPLALWDLPGDRRQRLYQPAVWVSTGGR